jgi:hypothetical protein
MKKKITIAIIVLSALLVALAVFLIVRAVSGGKPPALEDVKDRYVSLIEASPAVNEILFGKGLPTYPRISDEMKTHEVDFGEEKHIISYRCYEDSKGRSVVQYQRYVVIKEEEGNVYYDIVTGDMLSPDDDPYAYVEKTTEQKEGYAYYNGSTGYYYYTITDYETPSFYYTENDEAHYDYCTFDCGYISTSDIKEAAEQVYSASYLAKVYESLFTGIAYAEYENAIQYASYRDHVAEGQSYLQKLNPEAVGQSPWPTLAKRYYDYETMQIVKGSTAKRVIVEIESYVEGKESERTTVKLAFLLEEGNWYLDSPSY